MTRVGMVLGVVGGLGAGLVFATSTPLMADFLGFVLVRRATGAVHAMDFSAVLLIAAASLTAMFARRFGWVVAGAAAVVGYVLGEIELPMQTATELSVTALFWAGSVAHGVVLGGALAALGAADRNGRRAIVPGLAAGAAGGVYLLFTLADARSLGRLDGQLARALTYSPLALCVVAGIGSLVLLIRRPDASTATSAPDWVLPATGVVAASAAIACVALAAMDPSEGLYVAAAAAVVIAAVAVVGAVLGALLAGFTTKVPWEAIALVGAAAELLASRAPTPLDLVDRTHYSAGPVVAVGLIALATGAMLLRLGDRVMQLGSTAVAGFTTFVVGGVLAGQVSGFVIFENPVWDRRGIVIGVGGLAVLALHLGEPRAPRSRRWPYGHVTTMANLGKGR